MNDEKFDFWFECYGDFVFGWVCVVEEFGVEIFGLGSEFLLLMLMRLVDELFEFEEYYFDWEK